MNNSNHLATSKNSKAETSTSKTTNSTVSAGKDNNTSSNAKKPSSAASAAAAAPAVKYSSTKFDNMKNESALSNHNNNGEIEESMGFEELSEDEEEYQHKLASKKDTNNKNTKDSTKNSTQGNSKTSKNPLFSSMDDTIGASVSHGQDMSVDSMKLEEDYDYYEDII